jgi:hypothetical protein
MVARVRISPPLVVGRLLRYRGDLAIPVWSTHVCVCVHVWMAGSWVRR